MTSALDMECQARWEVEGFRRGLERYRDAAANKAPHELPGGQRLLRSIVPPLIHLIDQAKEEGRTALAGAGRTPLWAWPIQLLASDTLAVIVAVTTLRGCLVPDHDDDRAIDGTPATRVAVMVSKAVRVQIEYETWAGDNKDLDKGLRARFPTLDKNVWRRWKKRLEDVKTLPWPEGVEVAFGAHMLGLMVMSGDVMALETVRRPGDRTLKVVRMSKEVREALADSETRAEVARPLLRPMIIEPNEWRYA